MPQGEKWWNPYRIVPPRTETREKRSSITHEKLTGITGSVVCEIETLSLVFVGGNIYSNEKFLTKNNQPVIPGTSLKGMIRSLAEIVGNGCSVVEKSDACDPKRGLCITCRMFGALKGGNVHMGHVSVGDAELSQPAIENARVEVLLSTPRPRHSSFYLPSRGRKLYFHKAASPNTPISINAGIKSDAEARRWIRPLTSENKFIFTTSFENLAEEELSLLLYCLALEPEVSVTIKGEGFIPPAGNIVLTGPMHHKIGLGKPVGLGSIAIRPLRLELKPVASKLYSSLKRPMATIMEGKDLVSTIEARTLHYRHDTTDTMDALRKILVWDARDPREFKYPDYRWFKTPGNSAKGLKPI
jgi:hypothetical protein